ncbi:hypothetical protein [Pyxidicoccus sp. MSG2]|uniref:hypothetical protein n=1 Tax=Pyxidicoccus sp. MSG2 TaxID=2996790 RepID=UPI00226DDEB3|nr:hypothetical protein [Pyxidicoccus sp. MSG2]MCY1014853.1 hypothetical protein [Pyxidicoccus sp. MSG2]
MAERAEPFEPFIAFYREQGLPRPRMERMAPADVPQPYHRLLVHEQAMTPTLEDFCGQRLALRVLSSREEASVLRRQVVLSGARDGHPVELGAIFIELACFDAPARERLREGLTPLGTLLREFDVAFSCQPTAYFRVEADSLVRTALALEAGVPPLFGRCNRILTPGGGVLADVVEVLAPVRAARDAHVLRAG